MPSGTYYTTADATITWSNTNSAAAATSSMYVVFSSTGVTYGQPHQPSYNDLPEQQPDRNEAQERARRLLNSVLDDGQKRQLEETDWFYVISQSGKRYRLKRKWAGSIEEVDDNDFVVARYCIHPTQSVPIDDARVIQKLMLESDEERFLEIANRW